eukprot:gb/GEZJ01000060.1/.p2 GENE.gb/GEZJ01000060.1/~~gb/GEZJ01000060.1/.p2  ORF type:complete len:169 (-),score=24.96 gb/GEZJ01000060.1/:567-1073(-)
MSFSCRSDVSASSKLCTRILLFTRLLLALSRFLTARATRLSTAVVAPAVVVVVVVGVVGVVARVRAAGPSSPIRHAVMSSPAANRYRPSVVHTCQPPANLFKQTRHRLAIERVSLRGTALRARHVQYTPPPPQMLKTENVPFRACRRAARVCCTRRVHSVCCLSLRRV